MPRFIPRGLRRMGAIKPDAGSISFSARERAEMITTRWTHIDSEPLIFARKQQDITKRGVEIQNPIEGRTSDADVCKRPAKTGMCAGYFPRWFFNTKTGKCEEFVYGGCQSNGNNFDTRVQCEYTCPNTTLTVPAGHHGNATCSLPKKVGPCRAAMPRYYFDVTTGKCERFIYGGCEANANNFHTLKQCQRTCKEHGHSHHDCESPKDAGPCLAYIPRWFFNVDTSECEEFIYGGCQGNYNNYESLEQCQRICARA